MGVGGQRHAPADLPPGNTQSPVYRRLGGPHGRSRQVRKISPSQVFDPRTVRHVASSYNDWAIPVPIVCSRMRAYCLLTYLLTYSMEQSPSWEANQ
jgi:hypothetical protein